MKPETKLAEIKLISAQVKLFDCLETLCSLSELAYDWDSDAQLTLQKAIERCIRLNNQLSSLTNFPTIAMDDYDDR
jgi:hypothetical protein